ncbi:MAG: class GN sortase [Pseudomonadota bacterium]
MNIVSKRAVKSILLTLIALAGMTQLTQGSYIKLKASAADWLIQSSWANRNASGRTVKPWPWADTWVSAKLTVPRLSIEQYVMKDASGESLAFGPGFVSLPDQYDNQPTSIVAGHRDTHFQFLKDLRAGDRFQLENALGHTNHYQVVTRQVIDTEERAITIDPESNQLILVTCYPFESLLTGGSERFVVVAVATAS